MEVAPGIHAVDFDGRVWAYLYREGSRFTLIDAGIAGRLELIEQELHDAGAKLADIHQIIVTHFHGDHTGTLSELQRLTGARTLAHQLDAAVVRGDAPAPEPVLSEPEQAIYDYFTKGIPDAPAANVEVELSDSDEIDLDCGARVIHVPGHTPGSIALYLPERQILFTGDASGSVNGRPVVGVFNTDPKQAKRSFQRLAELEFEIACFGHGPAVTHDASASFRQSAAQLSR
jgi:glyoxylase-like metal-dependent hydrolase (beta-lactamase superfamily II)